MADRKKTFSFSRIALLNRGEPAIRFIQAIRDLNREEGRDLQVIAFYTEPDKESPFTLWADETYFLGSPQFLDETDLDEKGQPRRKSTYLNYPKVRQALIETKAQAVWPGWGFAAEDPAFVDLCEELNIVFIGPPAEVMRKLGDKISSKMVAEKANAPVIPWSGGEVATEEEAKERTKELGYPIVIKASAGGGGRGIRIVEKASLFSESFHSAKSEALKAFGDDRVFLEKIINKARHIEVQIAADLYGNVWALGVRDCSVQRRNQKIIEESPSPVLSPDKEKEICQAAINIAKKAGYFNLGTAEFLFTPEDGQFYFMEMNTRLQVEHPVTEEVYGIDLVKLQIHLSMGEKLPSKMPQPHGHAIEVRLNAEDPEQGFAPTPGKIISLAIPTGPGIRFDTGIREGDSIPGDFDSMVAKIISYGKNRDEARARLDRALTESVIIVDGGATNKGLLLEILRHPSFQKGLITTRWLDELQKKGVLFEKKYPQLALASAAIETWESKFEEVKDRFFLSASKGRPTLPASKSKPFDISLCYEKNTYTFQVCKIGPTEFRIYTQPGQWFQVQYRKTRKNRANLIYQGKKYEVICALQKSQYHIEVEGVSYRVTQDTGGAILSPMPALVLAIHVKEGEEIHAGQKIATLEAMKMEMPIYASQAGKVKKILISLNAQVPSGSPLLSIEAQEGENVSRSTGKGLTFPGSSKIETESPAFPEQTLMGELKNFLLGYEVKEDYVEMVLKKLFRETLLESPSRAILEELKGLLEIYLETEILFQKGYFWEDLLGEKLSPKTHLYMYLNWFENEGQGLPKIFIDRLMETLGRYEINELKPSSQIKSALLWLFRSHYNITLKNKVVSEILRFFLQAPSWLHVSRRRDFRNILTKIAELAQGQYPDIYNLSRQVLYALFDRRILERRWNRIIQRVDEILATFSKNSSEGEKASQIAWLVNVAPSLLEYLSKKIQEHDPIRPFILEVITRRLYRNYHLQDLYTIGSGEETQCVVTIEEGKNMAQVVVQHCAYESLDRAIDKVKQLHAQLNQPRILTDIILHLKTPVSRSSEEEYLHSCLAKWKKLPIERICILVTSTQRTIHSYTFQKTTSAGWEEIQYLRDIHPSINRRLELWRFGDFSMERLPSREEIYVFKGKSKENEKDERLFVLSEIRDLAPIRNEQGEIIQLPHVENVLLVSFEALREELAKRESTDTLNWNRVIVYVLPPVMINKKEVEHLFRRLAPLTRGLDLEKVVFRAKLRENPSEIPKDTVIQVRPDNQEMAIVYKEPDNSMIKPMTNYARKVLWSKQKGFTYPYELIRMITPSPQAVSEFPPGEFQEYDLFSTPEHPFYAEPVKRQIGQNTSNVVFGIVTNYTEKYPEGLKRVLLLGDCSQSMGSLAESECARIIASLNLCEEMKLPLEWIPVSSGAKISMDSGTENLDWTARVLRRIVEFTQAGGMINIIVDGINVGAQSYWNAEATMLMHTRGSLIMTPRGSMVLTGKEALDYSGGISAEDNMGIGGFEQIMGPSGQAQYYAKNLVEAYQILFQFYECTYIASREALPRRKATKDPLERNICLTPYQDDMNPSFEKVGDILGEEKNAGKKKTFDIRQVMVSLKDQDTSSLERWKAMKNAEIAVVMDTHIGGYPTCLVGVESKHILRYGHVPSDGPEVWTGGTLFPRSSKKIARAINGASQNRPVVILANLSGFDGSPESLRKLQLEYGAEIGRAVVNYQGPLLLFCIIARYHGGAYVVFSKALNPRLHAAALEGSYASVIGGAPAAAVVFPRQVRSLVLNDERILKMKENLLQASPKKQLLMQQEYQELYQKVYTEKLGQIASKFDAIHTVHRAKSVKSLDEIITPENLRPFVIDQMKKSFELYGSSLSEKSVKKRSTPKKAKSKK